MGTWVFQPLSCKIGRAHSPVAPQWSHGPPVLWWKARGMAAAAMDGAAALAGTDDDEQDAASATSSPTIPPLPFPIIQQPSGSVRTMAALLVPSSAEAAIATPMEACSQPAAATQPESIGG